MYFSFRKPVSRVFSAAIFLSLFFACGCGSGSGKKSDVDVDLTRLSSTMVFSEVSNILMNPEEYQDKTMRMEGEMAIYPNYEQEDSYYYTVIVADATACCAQGLEFVLEGGSVDIDDYPEAGTQISVVGTGEVYVEDDVEYFHLVSAKVTLLD